MIKAPPHSARLTPAGSAAAAAPVTACLPRGCAGLRRAATNGGCSRRLLARAGLRLARACAAGVWAATRGGVRNILYAMAKSGL